MPEGPAEPTPGPFAYAPSAAGATSPSAAAPLTAGATSPFATAPPTPGTTSPATGATTAAPTTGATTTTAAPAPDRAPPAFYARVAGPSTIFPRGFLWQFPVWYAAVVAYLALATWPPLWFRAAAAAGLLGVLLTLLGVLGSLNMRAFCADDTGITLGLPATTKRRGRRRATRHLPWDQIERLRLRPRRNGAGIEIFLSENAPVSARAVRPPPAERAWRAILLLIPFWYLRRPTGLLTPIDGPPRYRAAIRGTTFDEVRRRLRALAPRQVPVAVLVPRSKARSVSSAPSPERAAL
jgi:hypothetical protein